MTTNPITPEALTGCECLLKHPRGGCFLGAYDAAKGCWVADGYGEIKAPTLAIPLSWCLAAPGMREALKELERHHAARNDMVGRPQENSRTLSLIRPPLAACDGKGE